MVRSAGCSWSGGGWTVASPPRLARRTPVPVLYACALESPNEKRTRASPLARGAKAAGPMSQRAQNRTHATGVKAPFVARQQQSASRPCRASCISCSHVHHAGCLRTWQPRRANSSQGFEEMEPNTTTWPLQMNPLLDCCSAIKGGKDVTEQASLWRNCARAVTH